MVKIPLKPVHPDRICWGCDKYCPADDLRCGNGTVRTVHPGELFGDDWFEWFSRDELPDASVPAATSSSQGTESASRDRR